MYKLVLACFLMSCPIFAQEEVILTFNQTQARDIIQSDDGMIWIATYRGLYRYDGLQLKLYRKTNYPNLITDNLRALWYDQAQQKIWIGSQGGLSYYNQQGEFTKSDFPVFSKGVNIIKQLDSLLFILGQEIVVYDGQFHQYDRPDHMQPATDIFKSPMEHMYWLKTAIGVAYWNMLKNEFETYTLKGEGDEYRKRNNIKDLQVDRQGRVFIKTGLDEIFVKWPMGKTFIPWKGHFEFKDQDFDFRDKNLNEYRFIKNGIKVTPSQGWNYTYYPFDSTDYIRNITHSFYHEDKQELLLFSNTEESILVIDINDFSYRKVKPSADIPHNHFWVTGFLPLDKDLLLLTVHDLWRMDLASYSLEKVRELNPDDYHYDIFQWNQDSYLTSRDAGLSRLDAKLRPTRVFDDVLNREEHNHGSYLTNTLIDQFNNLWLRTRTGHSVIEGSTHSVHNYPYQLKPDSTLLGINGFFEDGSGNVWCFEEGLYRHEANNKSFGFSQSFFNQGDLEDRIIFDIASSKDNRLWILTQKSIISFNPVDQSKNEYPLKIDFDELRRSEIGFLDERRFYLATTRGIYIADIQQINKRLKFSKPYLENIQISDSTFSNLFYSPITLPAKTRQMNIAFSRINHSHIAGQFFDYRLRGSHENWISTKNTQAIYQGLRGGDYSFELRFRDPLGFTSATASYPIVIEKAWFETSLFRILAICCLGFVLVSSIQFRFNRIRKNAKNQIALDKKMASLEMQALKARMNPHFVFNSLNSIQSLITEGDELNALSYLNKFAKLIRKVLHHSEQSAIRLSDEIDILKKYIELERLRFDEVFEYHIGVDPVLLDSSIKVPNLLLQPYVENAIQHGLIPKEGKGNLLIEVMDKGNFLEIIIQDNGIGRSAAEELKMNKDSKHQSIGMKVTKDRILLANNQKLSNPIQVIDLFDNDQPSGTKVIIKLPLEEELA